MRRYAFFFAGLFLAADLATGLAGGLAGGLAAGFAVALAAAPGATGACLLTAAFFPFAASFTGAAPEAAAVAAAAPGADFAALGGVFGANFEPLAPLRPHLPRSGAAASNAWHSPRVRLLGSLSFGIFALRALSVI